MAIVDNFSESELREIVQSCTSKRQLMKALGYKSLGANFDTIERRTI